MSAVLIAATEHDARRWQRSQPDTWDTVISVHSPAGVRGMDLHSVHVTPLAAKQMSPQFHEDLEFRLALTNEDERFIQFLRD